MSDSEVDSGVPSAPQPLLPPAFEPVRPPPYRPVERHSATPPTPVSRWAAPPTTAQSAPTAWSTSGPTVVETENARFTVQVVDPARERRRRVALRAVALLAVAGGILAGVRLGAAPVGRWIDRTTASPATSVPDPCQAAFDRARTDPSQTNLLDTVAACGEEQWAAQQASSPVPAAVLRDLCAARGDTPAPACVAVDAQLKAEVLAAAAAAPPPPPPSTIAAPSIEVPQLAPGYGGPPTTVFYYFPGQTYSYPSDNYGGRLPSQPPRNGYATDPSGNYGGRIPSQRPGL